MKTDRRGAQSAVITPLGEGGIGVVQIVGPGAVRIAERIFRPTKARDVASAAAGRLYHGLVVDDGDAVDEVILRVCPEAELVEINCHGGIAAVRRVHDAVVRSGARAAEPAELLSTALGHGLDEVQREALRFLPRAATRLAVRMLLSQYDGALSSRLSGIETTESSDAMSRALSDLLATAEFGIGLCMPRRIVVAGRPNVGKSTLVNALLREERIIVHHLPGTTRDAIGEMAELQGIPFELIDTAGIRQTKDSIEMIGVAESKRQIDAADIILLVLDQSVPLDAEDEALLAIASGRESVVVANKIDREPAWPTDRLAGRTVLPLSALRGDGLKKLEAELVGRCGGEACSPEHATVFTKRQRDLLASARTALLGQDVEGARASIRRCRGPA